MNDREILQQYSIDISNFLILKDSKQEKLIEEMISGNKKSADKLIEHHLKLVLWIAKTYSKISTVDDFLDLIQEGNLSLCKTVRAIQNNKILLKDNKKLTAFVRKNINGKILQAIAEKLPLIKVTKTKFWLNKLCIKVTNEFEQEKGREPTIKEISEKIEQSEGRIMEALKISNIQIKSTESNSHNDEKGGKDISFKDTIKDTKDSCIKEIDKELEKEIINKNLKKLTIKQQLLISKLYGLGDEMQKTQKEILKELKISRQAVWTIKQRAFKTLRKNLKQ